MGRTTAGALILVGVLALVVAGQLLRAAGRAPTRPERLPDPAGPRVDPTPPAAASGEEPRAPAPGAGEPLTPLTPVSPAQQEQYAAAFSLLQARYVERPRQAIADAEREIRGVMTDRGYPIDSGG